jgi:hypothetical protein
MTRQTPPIPWLAWLILWRPRRVQTALERVSAMNLVDRVPSPWQIALGVLRMVNRLFFRSETVGLCRDHPVRATTRARLLQYRPLRFPFLLWERAVAPFDLSGLVSTPERMTRHLLGAHHEGIQCVYDLAILACTPGSLASLEERALGVVDGTDPRAEWLRDLVVFEGYHEQLLAHVQRFRAHGPCLTESQRRDPDLSFEGFLRWCAAQPTSPRETWRAWRQGTFQLNSPCDPLETP